MHETERFDAVVVGTGQGGKPLARALAQAGRTTAIVERDRVGGTCVVRGCTPTKTMVASARVAYLARRSDDYGVETGPVSVDMETVRKRKRTMVDRWVSGARDGLESRENLELVFGEARFRAPREIEIDLRDGGTRRLAAEHVFLNVGARPRVPAIEGLDEVDFLDSTSIMELGEVPEHLIVLGGGFIGLEFGQMFRRFGAAVTVIDRGERLAGREDDDVSQAIAEIFEEDGIDVVLEAEAKRVEPRGNGLELVVEAAGEERAIVGSHLLVAVGRASNADLLNLDAAGIDTDERGWIPVNERLETGVEGIWAMGDVTGAAPFTHTAYDDYRVIEANLLNGRDRTTEDRILPYAVFIDPQLGRVGATEREAREQGIDVRVAKLPMSRVARAIELDETRGFMKAVVDGETDRILGAAVLGIEGGEVVSVLEVAMMGDLCWTALRDAVIAHPTLAESLNNLFMTLE